MDSGSCGRGGSASDGGSFSNGIGGICGCGSGDIFVGDSSDCVGGKKWSDSASSIPFTFHINYLYLNGSK